MHSALYEGWVRHRRREPVQNAFRYRLYLLYLDLAELPQYDWFGNPLVLHLPGRGDDPFIIPFGQSNNKRPAANSLDECSNHS